jgi:hypothetical protein
MVGLNVPDRDPSSIVADALVNALRDARLSDTLDRSLPEPARPPTADSTLRD